MYSADFARSDFDQFWRKPDEQRETIGFRLCVSSLHEEMEQ
jgi:hypothetical protein